MDIVTVVDVFVAITTVDEIVLASIRDTLDDIFVDVVEIVVDEPVDTRGQEGPVDDPVDGAFFACVFRIFVDEGIFCVIDDERGSLSDLSDLREEAFLTDFEDDAAGSPSLSFTPW